MISKPSRLSISGIMLVCAAFLAACGGSSTPKVTSVTVTPVSGEIYVSAAPAGGVRGAALHTAEGRRPAALPPAATATCGSLQYAATANFNNRTTQVVTNTATWSSSSTSVAQINSTGLATGIGLGTTNISATFQNVSSTGEPLAVDQLNSITLSPNSATQPPSSSQQFFAIGNFTLAAGGTNDLDVSSQVTWDSTDKTVATVDNTGNATTVGPGSTTITATSCDGITVGRATLLVNSPTADSLLVAPATMTISTGTTTLFTVMEKLVDGTIKALPPGTVVTWSSATTSIATVDPISGVALGVAAGTANIIASSTGLNPGTAVLTVQAATARFAYVADAQGGNNTGSISGYSVDVTSATPLTPLLSTPVVPASTPQQVLLHPSGDFMYYLDGSGFLHIDVINSADGSFAESLLQNPVQASASNTSTNVGVIDPTGRFIYVISSVDNTIFGFSITQTPDKAAATNGLLTGISGMSGTTGYNDATLNSPSWILTDRAGKYVYVVNSGGNTISEYTIDPATGVLSLRTDTPTIATGTTPLFGTTDVNGHLYVANEAPQSVSAYSIDTSNSSTAGQLKAIGTGPFPINNASFTINVITDPTGKYLYVLDSTAGAPGPLSQVFAFNLNPATGVIGSQIGTPLLTGNSPTGMAIDPTGVLLAIDNNFDNTISLFTIGSTTPGGLTPATPPTVATDNQPLFVVFYTALSGQ